MTGRPAPAGRIWCALAAGAAVAASAVLLPIPGAAGETGPQEPDEIHLYSLSGSAAGIGVVFNRKDLVPVDPLVDVGFPRVAARLDSAPASSVHAAPVEPGVAGNLAAAGPALAGVPPGVVPPYPFYADAGYPAGPEQAEVGSRQLAGDEEAGTAKGIWGAAEARGESARGAAVLTGGWLRGAPAESGLVVAGGRERFRALADALAGVLRAAGAPVQRLEEPSDLLVDFEAGGAEVATGRSGRLLTGRSRGRLAGVKLLGGLISFDVLEGETLVEWPDPGADPVVRHATRQAGGQLLGVPVTFNEKGLDFDGAEVPFAIEQVVNDMVRQGGATFRGQAGFRGDRVSAGPNAARVTALAFDFEGQVQPGETDILHLSLGDAALTYDSEVLILPGVGSDGGVFPGGEGDTGLISEEATAAFDPEPAGVVPAIAGPGETTAASPDGLALSDLLPPVPSAGSAEVFGSAGGPAGLATPRFASDGSGETALEAALGGRIRPAVSQFQRASNRMSWVIGLFAAAGALWLLVLIAGRFRLLSP